jgi:hypothetical protein
VTREFGYVTRWEDWHRDDNMTGGNPVTLANIAYNNQDCGVPASIVGQISPHFLAGPVINDQVDQYYAQVLTTYPPNGGTPSVHTWYFVGCHDYTNAHLLAQPLNLTGTINVANLPQIGGGTEVEARAFLQEFGVTGQQERRNPRNR